MVQSLQYIYVQSWQQTQAKEQLANVLPSLRNYTKNDNSYYNIKSSIANMSSSLTRTNTYQKQEQPQQDTIDVQLDSLDSSNGFNTLSLMTTTEVHTKTPDKPTNVLKSKIFIMTVVFSCVLITLMCIGFLVHYEMKTDVSDGEEVGFWNVSLPAEQRLWYDKGIDELKAALMREINRNRRARNVILFVGDGMGPNTVTAARIYGYKEEGLLSWERFAHMGLLKTYCADKQVPDSFATATALFAGIKTNYETGGVDATVSLANCSASLNAEHHAQNIMQWAQADGMNTGFVTTTRVTHATPAALYAHTPDRRWECDSTMPAEAHQAGCKDIGRQLVEGETGQRINVIMGGGRQTLVTGVNNSTADPIDAWACNSHDGRNFVNDWEAAKLKARQRHAVVQNAGELKRLNAAEVDYVMGIFANGHLKYEHERDRSEAGMPSLKEMTLKALEVLRSKDRGFLLVVESGLIDLAHHRGNARKALAEVLALNDAVNATLQQMKNDMDDTLIIVTADHAHSLNINGYPERGANILGLAGNSKTDNIPYTTLTYATASKGFQVDDNGKRLDPSVADTTDWEYAQQAAINTDEVQHGGSDVAIHAEGAMSYLFHGVHEQTYVAHVISYALRIGRFRDSTITESLAALLPL